MLYKYQNQTIHQACPQLVIDGPCASGQAGGKIAWSCLAEMACELKHVTLRMLHHNWCDIWSLKMTQKILMLKDLTGLVMCKWPGFG